jgi:hypothetical protein
MKNIFSIKIIIALSLFVTMFSCCKKKDVELSLEQQNKEAITNYGFY